MAYNMNPIYGEGDLIEYQTFGGGTRIVRVEAREEDIKNGSPGFDGIVVGGSAEYGASVWGYDDQITRVVEVAS